jgi:dienelactone hydrolase
MKEFYQFLLGAFLCLCFSLSLSFRAQSQVQTARHISTGPFSNGFYEYLPAGYNTGSQTYPLIIFCHGQGENGDGNAQLPNVLDNGIPKLIAAGTFPTSFTVNGNTFSFIVITPQFTEWPPASAVQDVINYAIAHYRVDPNRIYLTGLSEGGGVTWDYAGSSLMAANTLAAILPVAGAEGINDAQSFNIASTNLPVYATHNSGDPTVDVSTTISNIQAINANTPPPNPRAFDTIFNASGHDAWTKTYDPAFTNPRIGNLNVYQWMLQFARGVDVPLPITLSSYTAVLSQDASQVLVNWVTAMEQNNKYFILERSGDGKSFAALDTIPDTDQPGGSQYAYTDRAPLAGHNFYRLSQVDMDGKPTDYGIREVTVATTPGTSTLRLSPNPPISSLYLEMTQPGDQGPLDITLSDAQGRTLRAWKSQKTGATWSQSIDISNLPKGTYFILVKGTNIRGVQQFLK